MPLLDKHKVIMIAGGLATLTGLVIAWRSYEAQKAGNAAAADSADQQAQQDAMLQQLMQPLSTSADSAGGDSGATVDTGSAGFDALLAELLGGGTTPPASGTSTGTGSTTPTAPPAGSTNPPSGSSGTVAPVATPLPVHVVLPSKFPQK